MTASLGTVLSRWLLWVTPLTCVCVCVFVRTHFFFSQVAPLVHAMPSSAVSATVEAPAGFRMKAAPAVVVAATAVATAVVAVAATTVEATTAVAAEVATTAEATTVEATNAATTAVAVGGIKRRHR